MAAEPIGEGVGFVGDIARLRLSYDATEAGAPATIVAKLPTINVVESADPRALGLVDVVLERSAAAVAELEVEALLRR